LEVEVLNVSNPQDPSLLGEGTRILRQLFPRFDASTALSLSLSLNSNSIRGEVRLQGIITGHETLLDELKLKFYELDGFKKAHEGKLSSASESDMKRALLQVEKANKKNSILQSRYNEISEKNLQLTTESERLTKEVASLKEKASSKASEDMTKLLKQRNDELLVKLNDSTTEMSILANQFNMLSDSKVKLQEEFNELKETSERSLQAATKSSQEEINKLRIELAKVQKSFSTNGDNVKALQEEINLLKVQKAMNSSSSASGGSVVTSSSSSSSIITHPAIPTHLSSVLASSSSSTINEEQIKLLKEEYFQSLKVIDELSSSLTRFTKRVASFPSSVIIAARTRPPTQEELMVGGGLIIENTAGKEGGTVNVFNRKENNWNVFDLEYHWPYEINQKLMFSDGIAPFLASIIPNPFELACLPLNNKGQPLSSSSSSSPTSSLSNHFGIICRGESGSGKSFTAFGDDNHLGIAFHAIDSIFSSLSSYQSAVKKELELSYKHYRNVPSDLSYSFSVSLSLIEIIGDSIYSYANDHPSSDGTRIDSSKIIYDAVHNRVVMESMKTEGKSIGNVKEGFNVLASSLKKSYRKSNSRENATLILELTVSVSYLPDRDPFLSKFTLVELASTNLNTKDKNVLALDSLYSAVASSAISASSSSSPLPSSSPFPPSSSPSTSPSSANRLSLSHQNQQQLPFDSSKLTKILQPLFHPSNRHMMIYHFSPSVLSYDSIISDLAFSRKLRNALIPSFISVRQPTAKELKDLEKQISSLIVEVKETKRKNDIAEKGLLETRTLAEELVKQLNDGNKLLLQRYVEEKDLAKQLKHDLSLTQRNLKKAIGETQEQRKINERLVKLVKGLEDERSSLNALIHE
jgi:hypothetical protein